MKEEKTLKCLQLIIPIIKQYDPTYIISGGFAAKLHGSSRELADIDISVNEKVFLDLVSELKEYIIEDHSVSNYVDDSWNMQITTFNILGQEVDIFTHTRNKIYSLQENRWIPLAFKKFVPIKYADMELNVIPLGELIAYKKHTRREVDLLDIQELERINVTSSQQY
jgi:hypothetical protein